MSFGGHLQVSQKSVAVCFRVHVCEFGPVAWKPENIPPAQRPRQQVPQCRAAPALGVGERKPNRKG